MPPGPGTDGLPGVEGIGLVLAGEAHEPVEQEDVCVELSTRHGVLGGES